MPVPFKQRSYKYRSRPTMRGGAARHYRVQSQQYRRSRFNNNRYKKSMYAVSRTIKGTGFPNKLNAKLSYADTIAFASVATGTNATNQFRINSIAQPFRGGGHQPLYHDTYSNLYRFYEVKGFKYKVTFCPRISETVSYSRVICYTKVDPTATSSFSPLNSSDVMEDANAKWKALTRSDSGPVPKVITGYVRVSKFQKPGINNLGVCNPTAHSLTYDTSPTNQMYLNVGVFNSEGATISCDYNIEITYYVQFSELQEGGRDELPA